MRLPSPASAVRVGRPEQALARVEALAQRGLRGPDARRELERARAEFVHELVQSMGGEDAELEVALAAPPDLSSDAVHLLSLIAKGITAADLLRSSVLGAFHAARALHELMECRCVLVTRPRARNAGALDAAPVLEEVVLGDANGSQAAILRTLLRISMKNVPPLRTIDSTDALRQVCRDRRPRLVIVDLALPGTASLASVLTALRTNSDALRVLVIGAPTELDAVRHGLPKDVALVARPLDRAGVSAALAKLGLGANPT